MTEPRGLGRGKRGHAEDGSTGFQLQQLGSTMPVYKALKVMGAHKPRVRVSGAQQMKYAPLCWSEEEQRTRKTRMRRTTWGSGYVPSFRPRTEKWQRGKLYTKGVLFWVRGGGDVGTGLRS
ncbi:unnamed protein product [Hapterophycus canaliculatus]